MISAYAANQITSLNNAFIDNTNPLGTVFAISQSQYIGLFNTYLLNLGVHASLLFITDSTQKSSYDLLSTVQWNDINPTYKVFDGNIAPQGAIYFVSGTSLNIVGADYYQNNAYSGLIYSSASSISLTECNIVDHQITGASIVGTFFFNSDLTLTQTAIYNSSLTYTTDISITQVSWIKLLTASLQVNGLTISNGTANGKANFILGNTITGKMNDVTIKNLKRTEGGKNALIELVASTLTINTMTCNTITNLLTVMSTTLSLTAINIRNLVQLSDSQFIVEMSGTTLSINTLTFVGNGNYGTQFPLFGGDNNVLQLSNSKFFNAIGVDAKVFNLQNTDSVIVTNSQFLFSTSFDQMVIFDLATTGPITVTNCVFSRAGSILTTSEARGTLTFISNVVYTETNVETLIIKDSIKTYLVDNTFLMPIPGYTRTLSKTPIQIPDPQGSIIFNNNFVLSYIGINGIFQVTSETLPYDLQMKDNYFINNIASSGGAIYLSVNKMWSSGSDPSASITDSVFLLNSAITFLKSKGKGGAIYLTSPSESTQTTLLDKNLFVNNTADSIGGAIYFDYTPPKMTSTSKFLNNFATRTNHIASYPVRLVQLDLDNPINVTYVPTNTAPTFTQTADLYKWTDIPSGPTSPYTYIFAVLDMYNQVVYDDSSSVLNIYNTKFPGTLRGVFASLLTVQAENGLYNYTDWKLTYRISETTTAYFTSSGVQSFDTIPVTGLVLLPTVYVQVTFRKCQLGEFVVEESYGLNACHECEASFWQTVADSSESSCQACGDETTVCMGGNNVGPKPGYWRLNSTADMVLSCPIDGACLGNDIDGSAVNPVLSPTGECAEGYQGNLCNDCIEGYGMSSDGQCTSCSGDKWHYILFGLMFMVQAYLLTQGVKETMELAEDYVSQDSINTNIAVLIRILVNYFQLVSVIGGIPITWPTFMQNTINVNSKLGSFTDQLLAIDCFVRGSSSPILTTYMVFLKILLASFGPFLIALFAWIFWAIYFCVKKRPIRGNKNFMNKFMTSVVVICFNMQPFAIKASFSLFQCLNLYREDDPSYFMVKDYDVQCWEGAHMKWTLAIGVPSLLLWIFILPGIMFNILRKNQNRLKHEKIAKKYAFLYLGYKKERYFWEFIIMIRKILLILASLLGIIYSNDFELYFSVMIAIIAYVLHVWNDPYEDHRLNTLESISLLSSEIVCFCAMYFKLITRTSELDIIIMIFGFLGNAFFVIAFLREFIKIKLKDIRRNKTAQKIISFVQRRLCCCIKGASFWKTVLVGNSTRGFAAHFIAQLQGPTLNTEEAEADIDAAEAVGSENYISEPESNKAADYEKAKPSKFKPKGFTGQLQMVKLNTEEADDNGSEPATNKASEVGRKLPSFEPRGLGAGHFTPTATQRLMTLNTEDIELNSASEIGTNKASDNLKFEPKGVTSQFAQTAKITRGNTMNSEAHSPFNMGNMSESSRIQRFETKGFSSHFAATTNAKIPHKNSEEGEVTMSEEGTHKVSELSRINTLEPKGFASKFAATTKLIRLDNEEGQINLNSPPESARGVEESAKAKKTKQRGFSAQFVSQPKFTALKTEEIDLNSPSPLASNRETESLSLKPSDHTSE